MKIFVSSTWDDLAEYRACVLRGIDRLRLQGDVVEWLAMEAFSAADQTPLDECLAFVNQADVYVGIFGVRYGSKPPGSDISFTEAEFRCATDRKIPRLLFLIDEENARVRPAHFERDPESLVRLNELKQEIKRIRGIGPFKSPEDLEAQVLTALRPYLRPAPPPSHGPEPFPDLAAAREQYVAHLVRTLDKIDATRIAAGLDRTLERIPLTQVYVPLRGGVAIPERDVHEWQARVAGRRLGDALGEEGAARLEQERETALPLRDALAKYPGLVILGDPGSGKSTFLKYVTVAFAQNEQAVRLGDAAPRLPIFLTIAAYAEKLREDKHQIALEDYLPQYYHDIHGVKTDVAPLFKNALGEGRAIVLLDGVDEVKDLAERGRVAEQVERFWNHHRATGNRLVISSRIIGYQRLTAEGLTHVTLQDFKGDDIRAFLEKWCPLIERTAEGDSEIAARNAARERGELEEAIFRDDKGVRELAANPLLLTLLALIKRRGVVLPDQRAELYEEYVKALVENWALNRNPDRIITHTTRYAETERVLAALALWMRETNPEAGTVDQPAMEDWLTRQYSGRGTAAAAAREAAHKFVSDLRNDCGLIVERGHRIYGFIHQTLEEYLAAKGLCYLSDTDTEPILAKMRDHQMLERDVWAETTLLAVGHLSVIQRVPGRAAQLVEGFLRAELTGDARGLNVVRAGEALRDVGSKGVNDTVWNATFAALQATMVDATLLPGTRRDAGIALGELGWLPEDLDAMVSVPAGRFLYGDQNQRREIRYQFDIGKYPVTNAQFKRFVVAGSYGTQRRWSAEGWKWREKDNCERPRYWDDKRFNNPLQPVVGVSWYEADAYCNWLKEETGKDYRLPTEEEWEKAARGVKGKLYPWGKEFDKQKANTGESGLSATTPVMMYPDGKSECGALDLSGNVWEWTKSKYDRKEPYFVLRGGSWFSTADYARSAYRSTDTPVYSYVNLGFRCVVVPPGSPPK